MMSTMTRFIDSLLNKLKVEAITNNSLIPETAFNCYHKYSNSDGSMAEKL